VIDFGDVTNDGISNALDTDSVIHIEWDVIMTDTMLNNTEYWVSAGGQYNNQDEIWVGSSSFLSLLDDYSSVSRLQLQTCIVFLLYSGNLLHRCRLIIIIPGAEGHPTHFLLLEGQFYESALNDHENAFRNITKTHEQK